MGEEVRPFRRRLVEHRPHATAGASSIEVPAHVLARRAFADSAFCSFRAASVSRGNRLSKRYLPEPRAVLRRLSCWCVGDLRSGPHAIASSLRAARCGFLTRQPRNWIGRLNPLDSGGSRMRTPGTGGAIEDAPRPRRVLGFGDPAARASAPSLQANSGRRPSPARSKRFPTICRRRDRGLSFATTSCTESVTCGSGSAGILRR